MVVGVKRLREETAETAAAGQRHATSKELDLATCSSTKTEELSSCGDLSVVIEGATLTVHSLILILASPVFKAMLSSEMREGQHKEIHLKGKRKAEFLQFWKHLQPGNFEPLGADNVHFLLRWADEYQVDGLKCRCEEYLMVKEVPRDPVAASVAFQEACAFNLPKRQQQLLSLMKGDMPKYLGSLESIAVETAEALRGVWPELCAASGVSHKHIATLDPEAMPTATQIAAMWPFVASAIKSHLPAKRYQELKKVSETWPRQIEAHLTRVTPVADRPRQGRDFLTVLLEPLKRDVASAFFPATAQSPAMRA